MISYPTEKEMRQALFGIPSPASQVTAPPPAEPIPEILFEKPKTPAPKKKVAKPFTPRLHVTVREGNEFEGKTFELIHEADTLSKLQAELDAVKAARKKFRYVEVVSVKSM